MIRVVVRARWIVVAMLVGCGPRTATPPPPPAPSPPRVVAPDPFAPLNLGFEEVEGNRPKAWTARSGTLAIDAAERHGGVHSLRVDDETIARVTLDAKPYAGKRITLRGWIKRRETAGVGLWLRADTADGRTLALDNMQDRWLAGTADWTTVHVQLDVPPEASTILVGTLQVGRGTAWFDDLALEVHAIEPPRPIAITGTVVDAAGAPVAGAEVALISKGSQIEQHARSDARGTFSFTALEGRWGISAHRAGAVGGFVAVQPLDETSPPLTVRLGNAGGVTVRGTTRRPLPAGSYLRISLYSDLDADVFAVPVQADGSFEAVLPAGPAYQVALLEGYGSTDVKRVGDRVELVFDAPSLAPAPAEVVEHVRSRSTPLATVEAGRGFADLAPLGALVGKARLVALGEATHGSREFFQLKHRLLEYLVAQHGFTVFAIEANQPECRAINDYVLHGKGDARTALAGIYFWTWNTEEVLAMIEWMRAWNADPAHRAKVQFTGFDMQTTRVAYRQVAAFVERTAPARAPQLLGRLGVLADPRAAELVGKASADDQRAIVDALAALAPVLASADADTRHDLRILEQATRMYLAKSPYEARDAAMAENLGWLLERTKARIVVWAHNGHISNTLPSFANMGSHLRARYQRDYRNVGLLFHHGAFQAMDLSGPSRLVVEHTVPAPPPFFATTPFVQAGHPLALLDLRSLPRRGPVAEWFRAPHPYRELGAAFSTEAAATTTAVLTALYDAVIVVEKTTRARPLPKSKP